ncbi:Parathyroid hormone/parathyroid hormone-related peptide receptor [Zootermopsis nevadensis]|uniref:Parathyroid hormone/parathyroid hormone-related peptide receptor n=2 Tax=Zootermopsis nevadensis TaxID=136037 RepID=A0A067RBD2_ZOONE|nr:Parathyroid hormone/parathyroid hormone-related peptide receptor [Zootermopsis nevadensis]
MLVINTLLMLDIVRVLWTKLRRVNTAKSGHIRRMTRATILLMPLFGVQFLVTLVRPSTKDCTQEEAYYYAFYTMDGLQGTFVALFYCYLNKEVHVQVLRTYNLFMARLYRLVGKDYEPKHRPTWAYSERRPTATSFIMPDDGTRPSVSTRADAGTQKDPHPHTRRPSIVIGTVSDILAQHEGARPPGTRIPRRSTAFPRNSSSNDDSQSSHLVPSQSHPTNSARQRKVSTISEEAQPENETVQTSGSSRSPSKAHDSDEDVQGSNQEKMISSQDSPFEDTSTATEDLNAGLSGHTPDTQAKQRSVTSGSETFA